MIRAIVSLRQPDGRYPEVGMTDRTVIDRGSVKAVRKAGLSYAHGVPCRIEYHNETLLRPPFLTEHW